MGMRDSFFWEMATMLILLLKQKNSEYGETVYARG